MSELQEALALANRVLDRHSSDPDDDIAVLARQLIRQHEALEWYKRETAAPLTDGRLERSLRAAYNQRDDAQFDRLLSRACYTIEELKKELFDAHDPMGDLIEANRDEILRKHREACGMIQRIVNKCRDPVGHMVATDVLRISQILDALGQFHPMHAERWCGWPAGIGGQDASSS